MAAPRALANRLGKHRRGIDRTTAAALANPPQALLLSPLSQVRFFGSGDHPLVADVSTGALSVCGRRGAPAFLWPIPEEGDGRRFRLGPPRSGATRQAPGLPLRSSPRVRLITPGLLVARCRPPPSPGSVWFLRQ